MAATSHDPDSSEDPFSAWVSAWNDEQRAAAAATEQREVVRFTERRRDLIEQLWPLLADELRAMAGYRCHRWIAEDLEERAVNLFTQIVFELPHITINPDRNGRHFLLGLAHRRTIDEYRKLYPMRRQDAVDDEPLISGSAGASMAPPRGSEQVGLAANTPVDLHADPASGAAEEQLARELDGVQVLRLAREYWKGLASPDDRIMELRWASDPPRPFASVAQQLGPGWTAATVRQRHRRVITRTRGYLRDRGIVW